MLECDDFRIVLAVKRGGSMHAAAEALGVDRATVLRRLDAIEAQLGARLFERRRDGCALTRAGLEVIGTPTYSGCPATEVIEQAIADAIVGAGLGPARVTQRRAPAWTTDWITPQGRERLRAYGIAPPGSCASEATANVSPIRLMARNVDCPRCGSSQTERLSAFGSTACKSLYRCVACREPFEHFKPI